MGRTHLNMPVAGHLFHWLRRAANEATAELNRRFREYNATYAEWALLRAVYRSEPTMPSAVAETLGIKRAAVTGLVSKLEQRGLLHAKPDPSDRRHHLIVLTKAGRELVPVLAKIALKWDIELTKRLSDPGQAAQLEVALKRLYEPRSAPRPKARGRPG